MTRYSRNNLLAACQPAEPAQPKTARLDYLLAGLIGAVSGVLLALAI